ncbi:MAG: hypothetical protein M3Y58_01160 [Chloroflexota bacterium]|nr:hypothetical protein [Chloroflexota bacterium]
MQGAEYEQDSEARRRDLVTTHGHADAHGYDDEHGHDEEHEHIHIPPNSFWPIILAGCITVMFVGFLSTLVISAIGALLVLIVMIAWGLEGSESVPTALSGVPVLGGGDAEDKLVPGARVITSDGRLVGRVTRSSEDSPLVKAGWIPTRYGYLARGAIDHIEEGAIVLTLTEQQVRERGNVDTTPAGSVTNQAVTTERGL